MARVDKSFKAIRSTVRILNSKRVNAIIAPVAVSRELSDRHELKRCYAQIFQLIQAQDDGLKGTLSSRSPHMEFIEHIIGERCSGPVKLFPRKIGVTDLGWPMDAFWLELGGGIGTFCVPIETIIV
jgi:hypothetical protein